VKPGWATAAGLAFGAGVDARHVERIDMAPKPGIEVHGDRR
jgi:hypothetical protein